MKSQVHSGAGNLSREKSRDKKFFTVHPPSEAPVVSPFDPRRSGQITEAQRLALEALHKNCANRVADVLGAQIDSHLEVRLAGIEQVTGAELLDRVADPSYLLFFRTSFNASALLQMDISFVFRLLDILLGGSAAESPEPRELTEIEQEILEPLARGATQALQESWQSLLNVSFEFDRPAQKNELPARLPVGDRLLLAGFHLRFQEFEGRMLAVFPAQISAAILRKLEPRESEPIPEPSPDLGKVQERLLNSLFTAELFSPPSPVSFRQLSNLRVGDVLSLQVPAASPLEVHIAGQRRFLAAPVRSGNKRGAQVKKVLSIVPAGEEKRK